MTVWHLTAELTFTLLYTIVTSSLPLTSCSSHTPTYHLAAHCDNCRYATVIAYRAEAFDSSAVAGSDGVGLTTLQDAATIVCRLKGS